jgi:hypothetical protein
MKRLMSWCSGMHGAGDQLKQGLARRGRASQAVFDSGQPLLIADAGTPFPP